MSHEELLGDRLLKAEEAAELLGVSKQWIYKHAHRLPFAKRLASGGVIRFSLNGMREWLAERKAA